MSQFEKLLDDYLVAHDDATNYSFNDSIYAGLKEDEARARAAIIAADRTDFEERTRNAAESAGVDWIGDDPAGNMLDEINALREKLSVPPEALRSEMHRCLGFAFEMKGGVRTWPVWLCSMETVKEAVAKGWLSDSQLELLIPRMGMSQVVYRLTDEGGAEFMRHHYSVPSPRGKQS